MGNIYKYPNLSEIEVHPEFLRLQQMMNDRVKSIWESENEAKEKVSKVILNKLGYPNNIELFTYQNSNKTEIEMYLSTQALNLPEYNLELLQEDGSDWIFG